MNNSLVKIIKPNRGFSAGLAVAILVCLGIGSVRAAQTNIFKLNTATMNVVTDWATTSGGVTTVAPGVGEIGVFDTNSVVPSVTLGGSLTLDQLVFATNSPTTTIGATAGATLALGAATGSSGINMASASSNVTLNCNLALLANTWTVPAGISLTNNGSISSVNTLTLIGGGTTVLAGPTNLLAGLICNGSGQGPFTLILAGSGSVNNNVITNQPNNVGSLGSMQVNSGTWVINNGRSMTMTNITINNGGTIVIGNGGRFGLSGRDGQSFVLHAGGAVYGTNNFAFRVAFGADGGAGTANAGASYSFADTQDGGSMVIGNGKNFELGGLGAGKTATYALSGGMISNTVSGGAFALGAATGGSSTTTFAMSGSGTLYWNGTIQGGSASVAPGDTTAAQVFQLNGGKLVAGNINATYLRPTAASLSGIFANTGGTLAPGDVGQPGKTAITGTFQQNSGSLAIDIGGASQANAYTNLPSFYDLIAVTGGAAVNGGTLNVNFINGYTPPSSTTTFTILTTTTGITGGPANFANNANGYFVVSASPLRYMQAVVIGNNLVLTNYGVTPPTVAASFTSTNAIGVAPFTVAFTDTSVGAITNRQWNFGDGGTTNTTATSVSYTYNVIGTYTNVLRVVDGAGNSSSATGLVRATAASVSLTWNGDGVANVWNTSTANWSNGVSAATYADPNNVTFNDSGSATPNLALNFGAQPASVTFNNSATSYTIAGSGGINGGASITLNGTGSATLLTTNTYSGPTVVNSGILQIGNGVTAGSIDSTSGITNNGAIIFNQPNNHTLAATITGSGSLTKAGSGTLTLNANNSLTFTGSITNNGGILAVADEKGLGASSVPVTLNNGTLQVSTATGFTFNNPLNFAGSSDGLNVNSAVVLPNNPTGTAAVTLGGNGSLQIDQSSGSTVSLPTNVVLSGGSIIYQRGDNYTQPGTIAGSSAASSITTAGILAGNTNTLNFADGVNVFGNIQNTSAGTLVLNGSANSTNILGGTSGLGYAGNAEIIFNGGTFNITNAVFNGSAANNSSGNLVVNGGTVNSAFYNGNSGGAFNVRGNLTINGGTLHVGSGRLGMYNNSSQVFTVNGGNVVIDTNNSSPNYGIRLGAVNGATQPGVGMTGIQTGGSITIFAGNSGFDLGCTNVGQISKYSLSGGSISILAGNNLILGSDINGSGSTTFLLTNTAKLSLTSGTVSGVGNNNIYTAVQVFSFVGGTLASSVNATYLRDSAVNAPGTFVNGGGTFLPGDIGYAGRSTITGNFNNTPAAALGIEIGGTTAANVGQETVNTNRYDNVLVVGTNASVVLDGSLKVGLLNGFEPLARDNNQFVILSFNNGINSIGTPSLTGSFTNISGGRVSLVGDATRSFAVTVNPTNVVLSNYQTPTPQAYFTSDVTLGTNSLTVTFTNLSNGTGLTNLWNFGDGGTSTSTAATVQRAYSTPGTNTVILTVGNGLGVSSYTRTNYIIVQALTTPSPTSITNTYNGSTLTLNWPSGQGWRLEAQTNGLATGLNTNWANVSGATPPYITTPNAASGTVFYRLVWP